MEGWRGEAKAQGAHPLALRVLARLANDPLLCAVSVVCTYHVVTPDDDNSPAASGESRVLTPRVEVLWNCHLSRRRMRHGPFGMVGGRVGGLACPLHLL